MCGAGLARTTAGRLIDGAEGEALTLWPGPLDALRLEPGDGIRLAGLPDLWRVIRVSLDERPTVEAERYRTPDGGAGDGDAPVRTGDAAVVVGPPLLRLLDLPALPGSEVDGRPVAVVAAEPWRPMAVHVGPSAEALTQRAVIDRPVTVGGLVEDLGSGVRYRWDTVNTLTVRIEGRPPVSQAAVAVLGGGNLVAVGTVAGWELIQFRTATLVGDGVWRLEGLLRRGCRRAAPGSAAWTLPSRGWAIVPGVRRICEWDRMARAGSGSAGFPG